MNLFNVINRKYLLKLRLKTIVMNIVYDLVYI